VHATKSGFRDLYFGAHAHGIHLAAGPDLMHLMLEGLGRTMIACIMELLSPSALSNINATLFHMDVRSHDEFVKFAKVKSGLQSLKMISAEDVPAILNSLTLALGVHTQGEHLDLDTLVKLHRAIYLFGCLYRNMDLQTHTEADVGEMRSLIVLFTGGCVFCCCL